MASYRIEFKRSIHRDLRKLTPAAIARVLLAIRELESSPVPRQSRKLVGEENRYRLRVGDYRVIYEVDHQSRTITVHYIRHRREAYR